MLNNLNKQEIDLFTRLNSPEKIQDFLDNLKYNYCKRKYVCKSPRRLIRLPDSKRKAHCLDGALFAAAAQRVNGKPPLMMELVGFNENYHFIAPFKYKGLWGAMGHSRTYTLKWRDPIYKSTRELALSYFPVFIKNGNLVLKSYSEPVNISCFDSMNWMTSEKCLEELGNKFDIFPHFNIFNSSINIRDAEKKLEHSLIKHKMPKK